MTADPKTVRVLPGRFWLARAPRRLGPRQRQLIRSVARLGSLSAKWAPQRQARSLAARGIVHRTETGSVRITVYGRAVAEYLEATR